MKLTDLAEKGIPKTIVENWKNRHEKNNPQEAEKLTHLQETVFESPVFWDLETAKNIGSGLNPLIYNFSFDILFSHYETIYRDKVSALWS